VNVFRDGRDYIFALTYGSDVQWVKNILASGKCELRIKGRTVQLDKPEVFVDPSRRLMPLPVRMFLDLMRVKELLRLRPAAGA
jgi:hypothetical protein